jgi:hypothetical protein
MALPLEIFEQHVAILAKTGSGKTVVAKGVAERLAGKRLRFGAIDPTGAWWGLRLNADGSPSSIPVVIFGGDHADVPIASHQGAKVARICAGAAFSWIIDLSGMKADQRNEFFTAWADEIMVANRTALHLFVDECHLFMPQTRAPGAKVKAMVDAANNLVSGGRLRGFRIVLISQRAAKVHKDSLTQVEAMILMKLVAPQDRNAAEDWIGERGDPSKAAPIIDSLPGMPRGEGWVWAPELDVLKRMKFPMCRTFDSSAAPTHGSAAATMVLGMSSALEEAIASARDALVPSVVLQGRIAAAKPEIAKLTTVLPKGMVQISIAEIERRVAMAQDDGVRAGRIQGIAAVLAEIGDSANDANKLLRKGSAAEQTVAARQTTEISLVSRAIARAEKEGAVHNKTVRHPNAKNLSSFRVGTRLRDGDPVREGKIGVGGSDCPERWIHSNQHSSDQLSGQSVTSGRNLGGISKARGVAKGELAILAAAAQNGPSWGGGVTREALTVLTGYKRSARDTYINRLRAGGLVAIGGDGVIRPTELGLDRVLASGIKPLPTGSALREHWMRSLPLGEARILDVLSHHYPAGLTRDDISTATPYKRSARDTYLNRLANRSLVEFPNPGEVRASPMLFD